MKLLLLGLICGVPIGDANPLQTDTARDESKSSHFVVHFSDPHGKLQISQLQVNSTYDLFIKGYPDEDHLMVLEFSNFGSNELMIFGDRIDKNSECQIHHLSERCKETWRKSFHSCPLHTVTSRDIKMTIKVHDLKENSGITYKTVNCKSGLAAIGSTAITECRPAPKTENNGLSGLEVVLLITLIFTSCMSVIFGSILLRILCRTRRQRDQSTVEESKRKSGGNSDGPVLVDNVLYASIEGEATKL